MKKALEYTSSVIAAISTAYMFNQFNTQDVGLASVVGIVVFCYFDLKFTIQRSKDDSSV